MIRAVYKDAEGEWWLDSIGRSHISSPHQRVSNLEELTPELRGKLTMLALANDGDTIDNVGKRISNDTFWVFTDK